MASLQIERLAESAVLKLIAPAASTLMLTVGWWGFSTLIERLSSLERAFNSQQSTVTLMQQDVGNLKALAQTRGEVIAQQHDSILQLQFDVRMLEQGRAPAKP